VNALLALSRLIDGLNARIGRSMIWLVLIAVIISAANAIIRKAFDMSSNAFLEAQWYLFSAIFLLCSPYTLLRNEHIRIDVIAGRLSNRAQTWIDVFGTVFFPKRRHGAGDRVSVVVVSIRSWNTSPKCRAMAGGSPSGRRGCRRRWAFPAVAAGHSQLITLVAHRGARGPPRPSSMTRSTRRKSSPSDPQGTGAEG
jgi:TRAP-type mannitol/chloroaromatic compound transport system permease small subunit